MRLFRLEKNEDGETGPVLHTDAEAPDDPGPDEVRVRMRACSLNYRDILMKSGASASGGDDPVIPLSDGAGEIEAVGSEVAGFETGDQVALTFFQDWKGGPFDMKYHKAARGGSCDGVLAETVCVPAHSVVKIPAHLDFAGAACLPCAAVTAWQGLFERGSGPVTAGQTVLCLGTGGVSIVALQLAKAAGARVIVTSSSDEKLERAQELGADETINYKTTPDWDKAVFELTEKRGVDHVIEVGGPGTLEKSMNSVAAGGRISLIGVLTGFDPPEASLFPLVTRAVDLVGIYVGSRAMFERMNAFLAEHQIQPVIDREFEFEDAAAAYEYLESGSHFGKVVIRV
ncbi:MAG: NAD(P)-dependent alcohol dehydrogenase [Verrucomicrobiales bacterium]|nr:NAD(P)-dependent alcohol dehydrogenase [Verrucomicrobiales bacterium]